MNFIFYLFLFVYVFDSVDVSSISGVCKRINIRNGRTKFRQRGRFVKFTCYPGYSLYGDKYSTCVLGSWDFDVIPKCVKPTCPKTVKTPANGIIYPSHKDAVIFFYCKSGYNLIGAKSTACDGLKWDNQVPTCQPVNTKPQMACDFEQEDICGWSHDLNHDFDWKRLNFKTPSHTIGTGPSFDHTKGEGKDGYYMYIESTAKNENDSARLISPIYEKSDAPLCFEFNYHMYGATTGTLNVYLKKVTENWTLKNSSVIFSKSGNQGNKWFSSLQFLGPVNDQYQIIIEGIRGHGYISDIAIDDVKIIENCKLKEDITTTTENYETESETESIESCENQCGETGISMAHTTCDCDDSCFFNNRCCPDYVDHCLSDTSPSSIDDTTIAEVPEDAVTVEDTLVPAIKISTPNITRIILKPNKTSTIGLKSHTVAITIGKSSLTTSKKPAQLVPITPKKFSLPVVFLPPPTTTSLPNWLQYRTLLPRRNESNSKTKKPEVFSMTVTTTSLPNWNQYHTLLPKRNESIDIKKKPEVFSTITSKRHYTNTDISTIKPFVMSTITSTSTTTRKTIINTYRQLRPNLKYDYKTKFNEKGKDPVENDVVEVPVRANNDQGLYLKTPMPNLKQENSVDRFYSVETEENMDVTILRNYGESKHFNIEKPDTSHHIIPLSIIAVTAVVCSVIFMVIVGKYKLYKCKIRSGNYKASRSQSDVRFLTNEEVLDFTLSRDYDDY